MTRYGRSAWIDRVPKSRVPAYPRQRGPQTADVVVIGGGLTGCATAYALAVQGLTVVLLEADRIGRGSSGSSAGWIADEPGVAFLDLEKLVGRRSARRAWQAWRRAALDFTALLRRLKIRCDLEPRDTVRFSFTPDQTMRLRREQKARRDAGLDAPLVNSRTIFGDIAVTAAAGIRTHDGATIDPYRAAVGLAAAATARGARIFEQSSATKTTFGRKTADVRTAGGTIRAGRIVVTTGVPTPLFRSLARHFWFCTTFLALTDPLPARVRRQLGRQSSVLRDSAEPPHFVRWVDENRLLVGGADLPTPPAKRRDKPLVQRTGQLMYELSTLYPDISGVQPAYGWSAAYARTGDGLPYIGPHRNFPHHLFAFGDASQSVTGAYLASRVLLRHVTGAADAADEVFGFTR